MYDVCILRGRTLRQKRAPKCISGVVECKIPGFGSFSRNDVVVEESVVRHSRLHQKGGGQRTYLESEEENLVTALVPSETACLASSPGSMRRTDVWISLEDRVERLE